MEEYAFPFGDLESYSGASWGMTQRDYFAAKAMQAIIQKVFGNLVLTVDIGENNDFLDQLDKIVFYSYTIADKMMEKNLLRCK